MIKKSDKFKFFLSVLIITLAMLAPKMSFASGSQSGGGGDKASGKPSSRI